MHGNGRNTKWAVRSIIKVYVTVFQRLYRPLLASELRGLHFCWSVKTKNAIFTSWKKWFQCSNTKIVLISWFRNLWLILPLLYEKMIKPVYKAPRLSRSLRLSVFVFLANATYIVDVALSLCIIEFNVPAFSNR